MIAARGGSVLLAFLMDLALGEPPERWHPVCWMGSAISTARRPFAGRQGLEGARRVAGIAIAVALPAGTWMMVERLERILPRPLGFIFEVTALWTSMATRSLAQGATQVEQGLSAGLEQGRREVARLVGRDTGGLDEAGVARAAVESVAENTNDGVVAPMFYGFVGGAPLALTYKMVNTLDSMIGYRDPEYSDLGWASARLDDLAGYLPARLTGAAAVAGAALTGGNPVRAAHSWLRDGNRHDSPNAGVCESVFAGALGVRLGGSDCFGGIRRERAVIGSGFREPGREDIVAAVRLMFTTAVTVLVAGMTLAWFIHRSGAGKGA